MVSGPRTSVPDALLTPLLEAAADTLRALEPADVPLTLRHLHGFDRRGLMHGPGPRQLRRALEEDEVFRARVVERFAGQRSVARTLEQWSPADAWQLVEDHSSRHDLPLLASTLWTCEPPGAEFGLGLVVAFEELERRERGDAQAARARARKLAEADEARRRADAARMTAEAGEARVAEELRQERRARRAREEHAEAEAQAAHRRAEGLEAQVQQAQAALEAERTRTGREVQRARALEGELQRARAELADALTKIEATPSHLSARDARALAEAAASTQRLSAQLEALQARVEARRKPMVRSASYAPPDKPLDRRIRPHVPAGVVASSPKGIEAMLKTDDVTLVIDGYNVTKRAWPDASPAEQRERLGVAVMQLHRRFACGVLCVFDGDSSGSRIPVRRGGIRVLFSDAGEEADEVIVREVASLPKRIPVVVVSSDAWIREHAEAAGAVVVPADALLRVLRPSH